MNEAAGAEVRVVRAVGGDDDDDGGGGGEVVAWQPANRPLTVPAGGPYDLEIRHRGTAVRGFSVGDLWLLAGQSNMQGTGRTVDAIEPASSVRTLDLARQWRPATDPVHVLSDSPDRVHYIPPADPNDPDALGWEALMRARGGSLAPSFGNELAARTGVPVGLIATAHGGTSMEQWSPDLRDHGGDSLYGSMLLSVKAAGGRVAGVLWYQGESDTDEERPARYPERMRNLVAAVRHDLGDPDLPFYVVQLGRLVAAGEPAHHQAWATIREAQRDNAGLGITGTVAAIDLPMDDIIHIGTVGLHRLGRRLARLATQEAASPDLDAVAIDPDAAHILHVRFSGVTGSLRPTEHIGGFAIHGDESADGSVPLLLRSHVADDGCTVILHLARPVTANDRLSYGFGLAPYCNLVDDADMAALAFGPVPIG
jgi:sialate O-acetylesterase